MIKYTWQSNSYLNIYHILNLHLDKSQVGFIWIILLWKYQNSKCLSDKVLCQRNSEWMVGALKLYHGDNKVYFMMMSAFCTWWRLFQKRVVHTKFYIYVFIYFLFFYYAKIHKRIFIVPAHHWIYSSQEDHWAYLYWYQSLLLMLRAKRRSKNTIFSIWFGQTEDITYDLPLMSNRAFFSTLYHCQKSKFSHLTWFTRYIYIWN